MTIQVRAANLPMDGEARERVERRLQAVLGRLAARIPRVTVSIVDQNGPRGGVDIACLVEVRLRSRGRLFVEAVDQDLQGAVNRAAEKAAVAVVRALERRRDLRRKGAHRWWAGAQRPSANPQFG